jgi:hypothetical protein
MGVGVAMGDKLGAGSTMILSLSIIPGGSGRGSNTNGVGTA